MYPRFLTTYAGCGLSYLALEDYASAIKAFSDALDLAPDWPEMLLLRARAFEKSNNFDSANGDLTRLIVVQPDQAAVYRLKRGRVRFLAGQLKKSLDDYLAGVPAGHGEAALGAARIYQMLGQYDEALACINDAFQHEDGGSFLFHALLKQGELLRQQGDALQSASRLDEAALYREPTDWFVYQRFLTQQRLKKQAGDISASALTVINEEAVSIDIDGQQLVKQTLFLLAGGQPDTARQAFERIPLDRIPAGTRLEIQYLLRDLVNECPWPAESPVNSLAGELLAITSG